MEPHSFLLFLVLNLLYTSQIVLPIHDEFLGMGLKNVSCAVEVHQWHLSSQQPMPLFSHLQNATLSCSSELKFFSYSGTLHFTVDIGESDTVLVEEDSLPPVPAVHRRLEKAARLPCWTPPARLAETKLNACKVDAHVKEIMAYPPDPFLSLLSSTLKDFINNNVQQGVCDFAVSVFQHLLRGADPLIPRLPAPDRIRNETMPLRNSELFMSLQHLIHALPPPVPGAQLQASFVGDTAVRLSLQLNQGLNMTYHSGDEKNWGVIHILVSAAMKHLSTFMARIFHFVSAMERVTQAVEKHVQEDLFSSSSAYFHEIPLPWSADTVTDLVFHASLPPGSELSVDINVRGFEWDPETYACSFSKSDGVSLSNIRLEQAGSLGGILSNYVFPVLAARANKILVDAFSALPESPTKSDQVVIPVAKPEVRAVPPAPVLVVYAMVSVIICISVVERGRRHHRHTPIQSSITMEEVSVLRLVVEDLALAVGVCGCFGCFMWSNCTTAATVILGEELKVYSFSLRSTVTDLWSAGLSPLSFAVALFSGVYPYVKLAGVLYYTAVRHSPDAAMLHAMDYIGKLSLLDTFVMLMMVTGLTINGVADVEVYHPFYIFLVGTIGSIAMGNYATRIWRRNTTLRAEAVDVENDAWAREGEEVDREDATEDTEPLEVGDTETTGAIRRACHKARMAISDALFAVCSLSARRGMKRFFWMTIASVPAWLFPLVSYRVGGVGPLLTQTYKTFTLYQLSAAVDPICLVVTLFTVLVAPCLYAAAPKRLRWLASWCAADALSIACLAGLLQLNDFIEFIVGEDLVGIYTAHAILHLALLPLFLGAMYVWWLALSDLFHWKSPSDAWGHLRDRCRFRCRGAEDEAEESQALLPPEEDGPASPSAEP